MYLLEAYGKGDVGSPKKKEESNPRSFRRRLLRSKQGANDTVIVVSVGDDKQIYNGSTSV